MALTFVPLARRAQENRPFDQYFGRLAGVRGFNDRAAPLLPNGNLPFYQPLASLGVCMCMYVCVVHTFWGCESSGVCAVVVVYPLSDFCFWKHTASVVCANRCRGERHVVPRLGVLRRGPAVCQRHSGYTRTFRSLFCARRMRLVGASSPNGNRCCGGQWRVGDAPCPAIPDAPHCTLNAACSTAHQLCQSAGGSGSAARCCGGQWLAGDAPCAVPYMLPWHVDTHATSGTCMDAPDMGFGVDVAMWNQGRMDAWCTARAPGNGEWAVLAVLRA